MIDGQRDGAPVAWMLPQIADADVFQLFWSTNSMNSATCEQQWETAMRVTKPDFIRPLYWEQPFPRAPGRPPPELEALHFVRVPGEQRSPVSQLWPMEKVPRSPPPPMSVGGALPPTSVGRAPPPMPAGRALPPEVATPLPVRDRESATSHRITVTLLVVAALAIVAAVLVGAGPLVTWALFVAGLAVATVALIIRPFMPWLRRRRR